jgi:DNA-binding transcriptional ArsR family regulator
MGSVTEDRLRQAAIHTQLLRRLPSEARRLDWTDEELRGAEEKVLHKLEELCAQEILTAVLGNWMSAGLCGVYVHVVHAPPYTVLYLVREDLASIYASLRRAASSVSASGRPFHEHVEVCTAATIKKESSEAITELRGMKPRALLKLMSEVTLDRARFALAHLAEEQKRGLSRLLYRELGDEPRLLRMDTEPRLPAAPTRKQRYAWLHAQIWRQKMHSPEVTQALGGVPRIVAVSDGDAMLKDRTADAPVDPLGPMQAKVWALQARELNKLRRPIKDPESKSRLAKNLGVSRSTLSRWLETDLPGLRLTPDTKGGVHYEGSAETLLAALKASARKRPQRRRTTSA